MHDTASQVVDDLLVVQAQGGSSAALEALVRRWQRRLWLHARRLLHRDQDAWDASQEAWMAIIKSLHRLDDPALFSRWAYRIVTNKCMDRLRREGRARDLWKELAGQTKIASSSQSCPRPDSRALEIREALERLEPATEAILTLRHIEGFEIAEISDILGIPEGTVKSRLHRAKAQLRTRLEIR